MIKKKNKIVYLLLISVVACLICGISTGIRANLGMIKDFLTDNVTAFNVENVSLIVALFQIVFGVAQPIFGIVAIKKSNSFVICLGCVVSALSFFGLPLCKNVFLLFIFLGLLLPIGVGALSYGVIVGAISPMIGEKEAAVVSGFVSASGGLVGSILSPVILALVKNYSFTFTMLLIGISFAILIPLSFVFGRKNNAQNEQDVFSSSIKNMFVDAIKNKTYIFLCLSFFTCGCYMGLVENHYYTQIKTFSLSEETAAFAMFIYGIASMLGAVIGGFLSGRIKIKYVLTLFFALRVFSVILLFYVNKTDFSVCAMAAVFGLTAAPVVPAVSSMIAKIFGTDKLTALFGISLLMHQLGNFVITWLGGVCLNINGNYTLVWILCMILSAFACVLCMCIKENK